MHAGLYEGLIRCRAIYWSPWYEAGSWLFFCSCRVSGCPLLVGPSENTVCTLRTSFATTSGIGVERTIGCMRDNLPLKTDKKRGDAFIEARRIFLVPVLRHRQTQPQGRSVLAGRTRSRVLQMSISHLTDARAVPARL